MEGRDIVEEFGKFPSGPPVPTMVEKYFKQGVFLAKLFKWGGVPQKRTAWVLDCKVFSKLQAFLGEVTSYLVKLVG